MSPIARPVRRTFRIPANGTDGLTLAAVAGVMGIEQGPGILRVTYDAFELDFEAVARLIEQAGIRVERGPWFTLKAAWYAFTDENARRNRQAPDGGCCSRPVGIYGDDSNKKR